MNLRIGLMSPRLGGHRDPQKLSVAGRAVWTLPTLVTTDSCSSSLRFDAAPAVSREYARSHYRTVERLEVRPDDPSIPEPVSLPMPWSPVCADEQSTWAQFVLATSSGVTT